MSKSRRCLSAGCAVWLLVGVFPIIAEDVTPSALRTIEVPADDPSQWPRFNPPLVPVPRDELDALLEAVQPKPTTPPATVLQSAVYEATLAGDSLVGGKFHWTVVRQTKIPVWQRLAPCNLAVSGVSWSDREAIAGTASDGQFWVWNDRLDGELTGTWSARGKDVANRVDFDLQFPEAVAATLRIRTPTGSNVTIENGLARRVETIDSAGLDLWELEGVDTKSGRIRIVRPSREPPQKPLVIFRQQLSAEIREDHLRFQARFDAEVFGSDVRTLTFSVPSPVELYAASMGSETTLTWTREMTPGPRHLVHVELPEPSRGSIRSLMLEGIVGSRAAGATAIPQIELVDGLFQSGHQTITVMRPMQIAAIRMTGCRQGAPLTTSTDSETLTVEQLLPDALLTLDLRRPPSTTSAQLVSEIDYRPEIWTQATHVLWSTTAGNAFQASLRLPAGWEATDVDAFNTTGGIERITWEKIDESAGATVIRIEFLQAVTAGQPRWLRILSRNRQANETDPIECPAPTPIDCTLQDAVLVLQAQPRFRVSLIGETSFARIDRDDLPDEWWDNEDWTADILENDYGDWFRGSDLSRFGNLRLEPEPTPVTCQAETIVAAGSSTIAEDYRLTIRPDSFPCERVLVWLSEPGSDVVWHVESPAELQIVSRRLPSDQLSLWELPNAGELWELLLPPTDVREFVISAQRTRTTAIPGRAGLAFVPQARVFTGAVSFHSSGPAEFELAPHGLIAASPRDSLTPSTASEASSRWRYHSPTDELRWVSPTTPRVQLSTLARMELRTLVSAPGEPFDYHRAVCVIPAHGESLSFQFPPRCEPLSATLNGAELSPTSDGSVIVRPARSSREQRLLLSYRTPTQPGFLRGGRAVPAPVCPDVVWTEFRWEFSLPPMVRIWSEPAGVRLTQPLRGPTWTERLFGPFGRSASESIFWPWSPDSWSKLTSTSQTIPSATISADPEWTAPASWRNYVALAPEPPGNLQFHIWRGDRIQLLAWLGVFATVIVGVALRRRTWAFRDRTLIAWLALLLAASFALEPPLTELIGGLWTGSVLAVLLPRRWLEGIATARTPDGHLVGSTQSFTLQPAAPTTAVILAGACLAGVDWLNAGEAPIADAENIVLVPVDRDGSPSRKLPIAYLNAEVLRSLRSLAAKPNSATNPSWLYTQAVYRVKLGSESPATIFAAYDVLVAGPEATIAVPLPLRGSGLAGVSACRVDGHPAVLTALPDGTGYQVAIARPESPVSAVGDIAMTRHSVTIEIHRPWQRDGQGAAVALAIPPIHDSRVLVEGSGAQQTIQLPRAGGQSQESNSAFAVATEYGPVNDFYLEWSLGNATAKRPPLDLQVDTAELLLVGPEAIQSRSKTVFAPQSGSFRQLTVKLPPRGVLLDLQTTPAGGYQQRTDDTGSRFVDVEFTDDVRQPAVIRCQYVVPKPSQQAEFLWQGLTWSSSENLVLTTRQRILAIATASELRVQPQTVEDSGLAPLSVDAARGFLDDLIGEARPRTIYQVSINRPIPFRTSIAAAPRRVSSWTQHGALRKNRLNWTMEAIVEPSPTPVYAHVLLVDRRLQIDSVSAQERNAERVLRWSEARLPNAGLNRVTVFLSDPMSDVQNLTVTGHLPISAAGPVALPNIRLESAEYQRARLDVTSDSTWRLEWNTLRGLKRLLTPIDPTSVDETDSAVATWEYEIQDPDWRANVRLRPHDENAAIRAVHVLVHTSADAVELQSRVELPSSERGSTIAIELPRPWELQTSTPIPGLQASPLGNGGAEGTLLTVSPEAAGPTTLRWRARAAWTDFLPDDCPLPSFRGPTSRDVRAWVAEVAAPPLSPRLNPLSPAEFVNPPDWATDWLSEMTPLAPGQRWLGRLPEDASRWPIARTQDTAEPARVAWLEHRLWRRAAQPDVGFTLIRLADPARQLDLSVPERVDVAAAVVDGRLAALLSSQNGELRLATVDGQPFQEAWVYWRSQAVSSAPWSGLVETSWIGLPQAQIGQQAVTVFPAANEVCWPLRGWTRSDWIDRTLLRLETLSDLWAGTEAPLHADWSAARLHTGYDLAAEKLTRVADALGDRHAERRERWQSIVSRVEQLPPTTSAESNSALIDDSLVDHPGVQYGMLSTTADRTWFWRFHDTSLRWVFGGALFLLAMAAFRLLAQPVWRNWLRAHPNASAGLIGLLWWLCLTPSILGLAILAWSALRALSNRQRWSATTEPTAA